MNHFEECWQNIEHDSFRGEYSGCWGSHSRIFEKWLEVLEVVIKLKKKYNPIEIWYMFWRAILWFECELVLYGFQKQNQGQREPRRHILAQYLNHILLKGLKCGMSYYPVYTRWLLEMFRKRQFFPFIHVTLVFNLFFSYGTYHYLSCLIV